MNQTCLATNQIVAGCGTLLQKVESNSTCLTKMTEYSPRLFCLFLFLRFLKKELGQYLAILTSLFVNNANILEITFCLLLQIYETVETINQLKINREFFLGFARDPPVRKWKYHEFEILF